MSNSGTITTLTNSGTISGGNGGPAARRRSRPHGGAGGAGIANSGTIATLANSGTIREARAARAEVAPRAGAPGRRDLQRRRERLDRAHHQQRPDHRQCRDRQSGERHCHRRDGQDFRQWTGGTITIGNGSLTFAGGNTTLGDESSVDGGKEP